MPDKKDDKKKAKTEVSEIYIEHSGITLNTPSVDITVTPTTGETDEVDFTRDDFITILEKIVKPASGDEEN
jgi:hypothetical protein